MIAFRLFALALALLLPGLADATQEGGAIRRFALVVGANDGGAGRVQLRYAASDALSVGRVLEEIGGVAPQDKLVLVDPDRAGLQAGFAELHRRLASAAGGGRVELFVYYSGHSDEGGLLLGEEHFTWAELRQALEALPSDVRVAILDSCSSGSLTRRKGGRHRAPFLVDESTTVKGHAYLTSASADEAAQESDGIGASFFTHYLVSGLRGAADTTRDGRVTLTEAYLFAFNETLARTEKTRSGAQHPNYEMQLVGKGDLVMTDLRSTSAGLVVEESIGGRLYIRDEQGRLVVELGKLPEAPVELGLAPGTYLVTVERRGALSETQVVLAEGRRSLLAAAALQPVAVEEARLRGGMPLHREDEYVRQPFVFQLLPGTGLRDDDRVITGFGLNLIGGRTARLDGVDLGFGFNWHTERAEGAMFAIGGNLVGGDVKGAQFAVGFNHAGGDSDAVQAAVGYNGAEGDVSVAQLAVGANLARGELVGLQAAVGGNWAQGAGSGAQLATGINVARGGFEGLQASSGANWAEGGASGAQLAAGLNASVGALDGAQISSGLNLATTGGSGLQLGTLNVQAGDPFEGAQIAVVNVGGSVRGAQIGVINVASGRVSGTQIGVLNYADDVDAPIGVLSVARKGQFHLNLWADETSAANLGVKLGGRYLYGLFTGGMSGGTTAADEQRWTVGLGLGGHIPVGLRALSFVNVELLSRQVLYGGDFATAPGDFRQINSLRLGAGWQVLPRLAIVAGPTLNVMVAQEDRGGFGFLGSSTGLHRDDDLTVRFWPGLFAGIQI